MSTRYLYVQPVPDSSLSEAGETASVETNSNGTLPESGPATAGTIRLQPGERRLTGTYRGDDANVLARELRQLANAPGYRDLPVYADGGGGTWEGYYVVRTLESRPHKPQAAKHLQEYDGALEKTGSRRSHWRAIQTSKNSYKNDFGNDSVREVAVPAPAKHVRWWDGDAAESYPSPTATRATEFRDVEVFDVDAAPYSQPTLLFDLAYDEEGWADCTVWDDRGFSTRSDGNGDVQWGRVYDPAYRPEGQFILSNRLLRIYVDDEGGTITAERWDGGAGAYGSVSLPASSWSPVDVDVRTIAPARIEARILFGDGSTRYPLDMILSRGDTDALWARTPNATSATPSTLVDYLDPVASTTIYDAGAEQTLIARTEVEQ